jgi:hypothetical protein
MLKYSLENCKDFAVLFTVLNVYKQKNPRMWGLIEPEAFHSILVGKKVKYICKL